MTPLEQQQTRLIEPAAHTFWHRVRFDIVVAQAHDAKADTVLDIGAGSGMLGDHLQTDDSLEYRFDESSPVLDGHLAQHFGGTARFGPDERVGTDTVCAMLDVIEHIEDDVSALTAWRERMDPGARLVVTAPAIQWLFSSWDTELGHFRRYSRPSLRAALTAAGFQVHRSDYLFPELLPIVVKRKFVGAHSDDVDMPQLSHRVNRLGHRVSTASARCRRFWPAGTSVVAVAEPAR